MVDLHRDVMCCCARTHLCDDEGSCSMTISPTHMQTDVKDPPVPIPRGRGDGGSSYHRSAVTHVMRFHDKLFIFSNSWKTYPHSMKKLFLLHRMGISFPAVGENHLWVFKIPRLHIDHCGHHHIICVEQQPTTAQNNGQVQESD